MKNKSSCRELCTNGKDTYHDWNMSHDGMCNACGTIFSPELTETNKEWESLRDEWFYFADTFESYDISQAHKRIANWWIKKLSTKEKELLRDITSPEESMADLMTRDRQDIVRQNFEEDKKMFKINDNRDLRQKIQSCLSQSIIVRDEVCIPIQQYQELLQLINKE